MKNNIKEHEFVEETEDYGSLGINSFLICKNCGACAGPGIYNEKLSPFLPDGSGLKVGDDCVHAEELIKKHKENVKNIK